MGRAPCCERDDVRKGPWSPEEDSKLKAYIQQHGNGGNWITLPKKVGLRRCGKSCRLRWLNYLRPNIKHGGFSEEEDNIIYSLYFSIGSRWSIIAAQLPGRTDNDIKNYWNTKLKKKLFEKQQKRRLAAAAKQDQMNKIERYVSSAANTNINVYETQPTAEVDQHMSQAYAHFSPGVVPQLFEQTTCNEVPTIPSTQPARVHLNYLQDFDQQMLGQDHNGSSMKLIERLEATLIDRSNNMNMVSTSHMEPSNCIISNNNHAAQMPHSTVGIATQIPYPPAAAAPFEYTPSTENHAQSESLAELGKLLSQNDNSLVFPALSSFNAENSNNRNMEIAYEYWNDVPYFTKNNYTSQVL